MLLILSACSKPAPPAEPAWTWVSPQPQGNSLLAIRRGYAVGEAGTILRATENGGWERLPGGTDATLTDVASDRTGTYVVGEGGTVLVSTDGRRFVAQPKLDVDLHGLWSNDVNRLFAVGDKGSIYRSTNGGGSWTRLHTSVDTRLNGIAGARNKPLGLWAVGAGGALVRSEGEGGVWLPVDSPTAQDLQRVRYFADDVVVAVGAGGTIVRSGDRGAIFALVPSGTQETLFDVWGERNQLFAAGSGGIVLASNDAGLTWRREASGTPDPLYAVGGAGDRVAFGGSFGLLLETSAAGLRVASRGPRALLLGLHRDFVVGAGGLVLRRDAAGAWAPVPSGTTAGLHAVWGDGDEVWIAGAEGTILHGRGGTLSRVPSGTRAALHGVAGRGKTIAIVGARGSILVSRDGGITFVAAEAPAVDFADVWIADDGAVLAAGERGTIWREGALVAAGTTAALHAIWGRGADVVVVGDAGTVLASSDGGRSFAAVAAGTRVDLFGVGGATRDDLTLVGDRGLVLRWRGGVPTPEASGTANALRRVDDRHAVGAGGTILQRRTAATSTP